MLLATEDDFTSQNGKNKKKCIHTMNFSRVCGMFAFPPFFSLNRITDNTGIFFLTESKDQPNAFNAPTVLKWISLRLYDFRKIYTAIRMNAMECRAAKGNEGERKSMETDPPLNTV